jgi:hypothetical protein
VSSMGGEAGHGSVRTLAKDADARLEASPAGLSSNRTDTLRRVPGKLSTRF